VSERVALVTGSTSGIGAAIARRLSRDGYAVALHSRSSAEVGKAMAAELPRASYHQADLGDEAAARGLVASVLERHGRLDALVNNAGLSIRIPHADLKAATPALWRQMLDVNLIAPFMLVAEAEAALRTSAAGGRPASIVNIGTHAGARPKGSSIPYAASKAALHHVTRLLALSLGPDIRVNAVAPGLVETPMTANWPDMLEMWKAKSPMKRPAKPEDIADLVAALCANDYVTGEIVIADGGLNLT
jgi:NAD(P)-dependent dehydrogenase (short-subunit alcohol dehydrogenase family)